MAGYQKEGLIGRSPAVHLCVDSRLFPTLFIYIDSTLPLPVSNDRCGEKGSYIGRHHRPPIDDDSGRSRRYDQDGHSPYMMETSELIVSISTVKSERAVRPVDNCLPLFLHEPSLKFRTVMDLHSLHCSSFLACGFRHWSPIIIGAVKSGRAADSVDNCLPLFLHASSLEPLSSVWVGFFRSFRPTFIEGTVRPR